MKNKLKPTRAFTLVEIVVVALLLGLLSSFAVMMFRQSAQTSEQIAIEQQLSNLSTSLMMNFRKDIRSSNEIKLIDRKLQLRVNLFSKSGIPEKESIVYTWKNDIVSRKTSSKSTHYDFASLIGKESSFTFNVILNEKKTSASITIEVKSSAGKYLLRVNEKV